MLVDIIVVKHECWALRNLGRPPRGQRWGSRLGARIQLEHLASTWKLRNPWYTTWHLGGPRCNRILDSAGVDMRIAQVGMTQ